LRRGRLIGNCAVVETRSCCDEGKGFGGHWKPWLDDESNDDDVMTMQSLLASIKVDMYRDYLAGGGSSLMRTVQQSPSSVAIGRGEYFEHQP
jgi:hypothetical protein